jgi:hypothetical protein
MRKNDKANQQVIAYLVQTAVIRSDIFDFNHLVFRSSLS